MAPQSIVNLQKRMGISCDSKVIIWKRNIEEVLSALLFLRDVKKYQTTELEENDMVIEEVIDVREETVTTYPSFSKSTYEFCLKLLNEARNKWGETVITDTILDDVIYSLQNKKIPQFRLVLLFYDECSYYLICIEFYHQNI